MKSISFTLLFVLAGAVESFAQTPAVAAGGVLNGASFARGQAVAPGSLVSVFGSNLAASTQSASTVPLSTLLGGATVTFNDIAAPLIFVSHSTANGDQLNAQIPFELAGASSANVVVTANGASSPAQAVQLSSVAPGIFASGTQAIAYGNSDFAFAAPTSFCPPPTCPGGSHPAKIGDQSTMVILATGLGPVSPPVVTGHGVEDGQLHPAVTTPTVLIGNVQAQVVFAGMSPLYPGVYQLNVIIATGTPVGDAIPLQIQMGGITTSNQVTIAVSK